jgi:hypothetical protein
MNTLGQSVKLSFKHKFVSKFSGSLFVQKEKWPSTTYLQMGSIEILFCGKWKNEQLMWSVNNALLYFKEYSVSPCWCSSHMSEASDSGCTGIRMDCFTVTSQSQLYKIQEY